MKSLSPLAAFLTVAIGCNLCLSPNTVRAGAVFVFDDSVPAFADGLNSGDQITVDGITMTFSNVSVANGGTHGDVEDTGILLSSTTEPGLSDVISFDFSFDADVRINTYDIGLWESMPVDQFFSVSGPNGTSGNNELPSGTSIGSEQTFIFDHGSIDFFQAGAIYMFSHSVPDIGSDPLFTLEEFSVTGVPEPDSGVQFLVVIACIACCVRRKTTVGA